MNSNLVPIDTMDCIMECDCGGKTYILLPDGRVECRSCGSIEKNLQWSIKQDAN